MAYEYTNKKGQKYYFHSQEVKLRGSGKNQRIFYFAKIPGSSAIEMPEGYIVVENQKTGLPLLKRG